MFRSVVCALALLTLLPAAAQAVTPRPKAILEDHLHGSGGQDWHVQLEVNNRSNRLLTVVVYAQQCGETGFTQKVPLGSGGTFDIVDMPLENGKGTWSLHGSFTGRNVATGVWGMKKPEGAKACDVSGDFRAQDATGHFLIGNPYEYPVPSMTDNSLDARRLRALKYNSRQNIHRFDTIAKSRKLGYELSTSTGCPGMHHSRKHGTAMWGKTLDPTAPQSLVYWCDAEENWTLAAFMYRADGKTKPDTYGRRMQWHKHGPTASWMTHLWLTRDPVSAFATCAPFRAFEAEASPIKYVDYVVDTQADTPCSDSVPADPFPPPSEPSQTP